MKYYFTDQFIVRQPLLPVKDNYSNEEATELFKTSPIIREALYLASPDLYRELEKSISSYDKIEPKLFATLYKYLNRMSFRSTPFGLFGNCGIGEWTEKSQSIGLPRLHRKSRLDMLYLCDLYTFLINKKEVQEEVLLYPNTSLYTLGDTFRYIEHTSEDNNRSYQISEVPLSEELEAIIKQAKNGEKFINLVHQLVSFGHSDTDSESFVRDCIQSQILVGGFEPKVTGVDNLTNILHALAPIQSEEIQSICRILKEVQEDIKVLDKQVNSENDYQNIIHKLKHIDGVPVNEKFVLQVDSFRNNRSFTLDKNKQSDILNATEVLTMLTPQQKTVNPNLTKFKKSFYNRYEDSFVPLVEVIDAEFGLGYPLSNKNGFSDLAHGIELSKSKGKPTSRTIRIDQYAELLHQYIIAAEKNNQYEFSLSKEQLQKDGIKSQDDLLPLSMSAMATFLTNDKISLEGMSGPSAINILSRFGHGEAAIERVIGDIVEQEDNLAEGILLAEILHLPEGRVGNIILHPKYRKHEIPFLAGQVNSAYTLPITDLEIGLRGNTLILRSKKLNKIIIPRLSNAHSYTLNALPLYHFLCDIQTQFSLRSLFFEWPDFGYKPSFFPRLSVGNAIISPAMWNIKVSTLTNLLKDSEQSKELQKLGVPRKVLFAEGDNTLVIDLTNKDAIIALLDSCKKEESVLLREYLEVSENFSDNGDHFSHQLILPLIRTEPNIDIKTIKNLLSVNTSSLEIQKTFLPGSEWAYFKLYGGKQGIERILAYELTNLLDEIEKEELIESWFFIRYEDPDYHLRLRFKLNDTQHLGRLLILTHSYLNEWSENKLIYKTTMDTYNREVERYLFSAIPNIEYLFYKDSASIINYLNTINEESDRLRWFFALKSIDFLLSDFGLDEENKLKFLEKPMAYFKKEFNADKSLLQKINKKFKVHSEEIHNYMQLDVQSEIILKNRSISTKDCIQNILYLYKTENINKDLHVLITDFTHMLINRLLHFNPRFHEMVIYEILFKYYKYKSFRKVTVK